MLFSRTRLGSALSALAAAAAFAGSAQTAQAGPINFEVTNLTFSSGDPTYSIATDITFQNLKLTLNYTGGPSVIALPSPTLNTLTVFEDSAFVTNTNLLSAVLTGAINTTSLQTQTSFGGVLTPDTASSANFTATLSKFTAFNFVNISILDMSGAPLNFGTLAVTPAPEPGSLALLGIGGLIFVVLLSRSRRRGSLALGMAIGALILGSYPVSMSAQDAETTVAPAVIDNSNWGTITAAVYGTAESGSFAPAELLTGPNKFGSYYSGVLPSGAFVKPAGTSIQIGMNPLGIALTPDGRYLVTSNDDERESGMPSLQNTANQPAYSLSVVDTANMTIVSQINPGNRFFIGLQVTGPASGPYTIWASAGADNSIKLFNLSSAGAITVGTPATIAIAPTLPNNAGYVSNYTPAAGFGTASLPSGFSASGAKITYPAGSALSPDGKFLYVACNGDNSVAVIDTASKTVVKQVPVGYFPYTVAVGGGGAKIAVSNWGVTEYKFKNPTYDPTTGVLTSLSPVPGNVVDGFYVPVTNAAGANPKTSSISLLSAPGGLGSSLSLLGSIYQGHSLDQLNNVGDTHPSAMGIVRHGTIEVLYVTKSNSDAIGLVLLNNNRKLPDFDLSPVSVNIAGHAVHGAYPNAIAVSPDNNRVYVAEAGISSVAVLDTTNPTAPKLLGRIGTGWYPTALAVSADGNTLFVANAKGIGEDINPKTSTASVPPVSGLASFAGVDSNYIFGSLQKVDLTSLTLDNSTVLANNYAVHVPADTSVVPVGGGSSPRIKHTFFIIHENKTFDSMLGNLNGRFGNFASTTFNDLSGTQYTNGQYTGVSLNTQTLAAKFATAVNYYSNSEESDAGHQFAASGTASDYTEKTLLVKGGRGLLVNKNFEPEDYPEGGYIFNNAARNGVSFKDYGALVRIEGTDTGTSISPTIDDPASGLSGYPQLLADKFNVQIPIVNVGDVDTKTQGLGQAYWLSLPMVSVLGSSNPSGEPRLDLNYPGYNFNISDQRRAQEFIEDFDRMVANNTLPQFIYIYQPNDHTGGVQATNVSGVTGVQQIADGDIGLGMVVNHIMTSPVYYNASTGEGSAIFITYDDAQSSLDHIHPHRTPLIVVSPYAKPAYTGYRHYITASIVKTEELLLGLPPNNLGDLFATDLRDMFQSTYNGITAADVPVTRSIPYKATVAGMRIWKLVKSLDTSSPDKDSARLGALIRLSMAADTLQKQAARKHQLATRSYKVKQARLYREAKALVAGPAPRDTDG